MSATIREARGAIVPRAALTRAVVAILVVGGMAATTNAQVFALLLSPLADDLGVSVSRVGALRTVEEVVAVATGLALAPFADRWPRRTLLMAGFVLMALAASTALLVTSLPLLAAYFVVDGVGKILLFTGLLAAPSDFASGRERDRALGFVIGSFALAGFTAVPLAGLLADAFSWRAGYLVSLALALLTLTLVARWLPAVRPERHEHESVRAHFAALARIPGLPLALVGAFGRFTLYGSVLTYSGAFLVDHHDVSVRMAGLFFSIGSLAFLLASVASGWLLGRLGVRVALVELGVVGAALVTLAFTLALPLLVPGLLLLAAVAIMGLLENASTGLLLRLAPNDRGAAMSLNELCASGGTLVGVGACALALSLAGFGGAGAFLGVVGIGAASATHLALRQHAGMAG